MLNVWTKGETPGTRDDVAASLVLSELPDFVCLQEFDIGYRQANDGFIVQTQGQYAEVSVSGIIPEYIWNPIFYLKERYTVVESGYVYLPDVAGAVESVSYTGTADGKSCFRSLVWAVLRDRSDGSLYLIGNFHASLPLATHPAEAAAVSATLQGGGVRYPGCVTLLCGDYNSRRTQPDGALEQLRAKGFADTYDIAVIRNDMGTWHELGKGPGGSYLNDAIDHILTLGGIHAQAYRILTDEILWKASDHTPTLLEFTRT